MVGWGETRRMRYRMYQVGSGEASGEGLPVAQGMGSHAQTPWGRAQAVPKLPNISCLAPPFPGGSFQVTSHFRTSQHQIKTK